MAQNKKFKTVPLNLMLDKHIGKRGSAKRESFEYELRLELLGEAIRQARQQQNLTQDELGQLVGVGKAQISKLENNVTNARFDTLLKVFNALKAQVRFIVELPEPKAKLV
ncbi:MAG: helix-turn-helix transcriptional regulator [Chitinophagaceae bacterium]